MEDLRSLDTKTKATEGAWFYPVRSDTGERLGCRLLMKGLDSPEMKSILKSVKNIDSPEDSDSNLFAKCTMDWEDCAKNKKPHILLYSGGELAFSQENAEKVYRDLPSLRRQALKFILNEANFLP